MLLSNSQFSESGFRVLRICTGVFLFGAAGLKAHGLTTDVLADHTFLAQPRVQIAAIEFEFLLALWLLRNYLKTVM